MKSIFNMLAVGSWPCVGVKFLQSVRGIGYLMDLVTLHICC
jgi:hypothetical protein